MATNKDLVKKGSTDVAVAAAASFEAQAGSGLEHVTSADILIPRLTILQSLSPQVNPKKGEHIKGAEVGMICDVGTQETFPDGLVFLPVQFAKQWIEWGPRASNKGLVAVHTTDAILADCTINDRNQPVMANGNYVAETAVMFGMNVTADFRKSFIPFTSTQLKKSRRWLTLATGEKLTRADGFSFTPPLFYRSYGLTTVEESNAEGDWSGWKVERGQTMVELCEEMGADFQALMADCIAFHASLVKGEAQADVASMRTDAGGSTNAEGSM